MNCSRFQNRILLHWRHIQRGLSFKTKRKLAPKFDFELAENVSAAMKSGSLKARHHPGIQKVGTVSLPDDLLKATVSALADYPQKTLQTDADMLSKYIWSRHPPLEGLEYTEKYKSVEKFIIRKEEINPASPDISEDERKRLLDSRRSKVFEKLKREVYHWKPINYNHYYSALYIVARLAPDYATLFKVLSEIKKRDLDFSPVTMLDFGSGVGSGTWAMDSIWPRVCKEVVCIDASADMNTLADRLLRGGNTDDERIIRPGGTFFKQFLPMSDVLKYDLVIASRSLFELPDMESRLRTLDVLWRKTARYLVIVEAGTNAGYKIVLEARDYILGLGERAEEEASNLQGHVFSPCPHDKFCPRFLDGKYIPCNFEVSFKPFTFSKEKKVQQDRFSYVVMKKGECNDEEKYPRVLQEPMLRSKHIICKVCTKYGVLMDFTGTKRKHSKECYRVLKCTGVGDLLPIVFPNPKQTKESANESEPLSSDDEREEVKS